MIKELIGFTGIILTTYGLVLITQLTRTSVNNQEEINQSKNISNISLIVGWSVFGILTAFALAAFTIPILKPLAMILSNFQFIYTLLVIISFMIGLINTILFKIADKSNADYGKNVYSDFDIIAAKKDELIQSGIVMTCIGVILLAVPLTSILSLDLEKK